MAANDAVDGATLPRRECYSGYLGAIAIQGGETAAGEVTELARTVRRSADTVVPGIGRTRLGHRIYKVRANDWDPIRAEHSGQRLHRPHQQAGHVTAPDQCCRSVRKFLPRRRPHVTLSGHYFFDLITFEYWRRP
jgi:hypothetical protein